MMHVHGPTVSAVKNMKVVVKVALDGEAIRVILKAKIMRVVKNAEMIM